MRYVILALAILLSPVVCTQAQAQTRLSIGISDHGVSLGFFMSTYPTFERIPGYPVYYDPRIDQNYFFYDGLYWVYVDDDWYWSTWYNGPWYLVSPAYVPLFILRIPVRYYRRPPPYFRGWHPSAPPRWGEHWGPAWERQRSGWDRWNPRSVPAPAPLPTYQRRYTGSRYPRQLEQQRSIESRNYRYQPRETVSRQVLEQRRRSEPSRNRSQENDQRQQEQRNRQQQDVQRQQELRIRQQQDVQRQQELRNRQQQDVQRQEELRNRQQQDVQRQQELRNRQQQDVQWQQEQRNRQQQSVQQQQQQRARPAQQGAQPAPKAGGKDSSGGKGRSDKDKGRKGDGQDDAGHP
ncbi:MAG: hypothetical protein AB1832_04600 [Pseudomonadota bacterium]